MKKNEILLQKKYAKLRVIENQDYDIASLDYSRINNLCTNLEIITKLNQSSVFVYDYYRSEIVCFHADNYYFSNQVNYKGKNLDAYLSKISETDADLISKIHEKSFNFIKTLQINEIKNLVLSYNILLETINNDYKLADIKVNILETDSRGNLWIALFEIKPTIYRGYHLPYLKNNVTGEKYFYTPQKLEHYKFSNKMLETLILLSSPYKNTEISEKLGISLSCLKQRLQTFYDIFEVKTREEVNDIFGNLMRI